MTRKKRPYTESERSELRDLCFRGRSRGLSDTDSGRCYELYKINPAEYAKIHAAARRDADALVNPTARKEQKP